MAKNPGRFARAKANFAAAGEDTAHRVKHGLCPECEVPFMLIETFRGTAYHIKGKCPNDHVTERFGYADKAVRD